MGAKLGSIGIRVADLDRSEAFYTALGLEVLSRIETPDVREVMLGSRDGGSVLMLATEREPSGTPDPAGGYWKAFVYVDDAAEVFARCVAAGAPPHREPAYFEQWKLTIAMVRDPDGYLVELGQRH